MRHELFCTGYGFVVDYIAEVLKHLRTEDYTGLYKPHFEISSEVSTRDQTGFEKTFSGLMKIIHPDGKATPEEIAELLEFAMECRRRVREQILRIDDTFKANDFIYRDLQSGAEVTVLTPEEQQYPAFAGLRPLSRESAAGSASCLHRAGGNHPLREQRGTGFHQPSAQGTASGGTGKRQGVELPALVRRLPAGLQRHHHP